MNPNEVILIDSGGQYHDGTTDTTRTLHFRQPTPFQKEMYTRVLKGNLEYERLTLPAKKKLKQVNIDVLARMHLWSIGEDYCHGTGHGVGHFLNVHEGPYGKELQEGHTWTDEPGFYKDGEFGIRIENLLVLQKAEGIEGHL